MLRDIILKRNFFQFMHRVMLWHLRYSFGRSISPLACGFYITSKCNFQCNFCNIWRITPSFQTPLGLAKKLISKLAKIRPVYLSFSGGEPLLVPYIFDLLAYAKECGIIYTHIVSNGYLMDENKAGELARARVSEISFSLDGEEKVHDQNRGKSGAFKKIIQAVGDVKTYAPKTKIVLNTILDPASPQDAIFAVNTAEKLGVKIKVQPKNEHPDFKAGNCSVKSRRCLEDTEKQRLLEAIAFIQKAPQVNNSGPFLENYKDFLFSPENLIFAKNDCLFSYHHIECFANQLFPCLEGMGWKEGFDITNDSIEKILASSSYRNKVRQLRKCSSCRNNYYICYYEPRLNFPVWNLIKSRLKIAKIKVV